MFPYQPEGILEGRATKAEWKMSEGEDRYRRGMYTYFWRLTPYPFLRLFDAPDAVTTCTRRYRSNTPLQALTLLNDPTLVECAQALATRTFQASLADDRQRLRYAFRRALGRNPSSAEQQYLLQFLELRLREFASEPALAKKVAPSEGLPQADLQRLAAWASVSRALLNLDEFLTRE